MKITISRHIFGSVRGYTTLAKSEDLSPEEIADLEIFSFGQTNESTYMNSLETDPAYISRPLRSGRWAVTRVFQGQPDEHNRTTLLFISAVMTIDDWLCLLKCDVNKLLYCAPLWRWSGQEKLERIEVIAEDTRGAPTRETRNKVLSLLAAVEKYTPEENTTIVVKESDFDAEVLRWLNMVLPLNSKQTFAYAARSLNDGLPLALISMAKEGSFGNSKRRTIDWTPTTSINGCPYSESLRQFWQLVDEPPWQFIDRCRSFSVDLEAAPEGGLSERVLRRKRLAYEVRKAGVRRKTHISWKLGVIVLGCAVLFCLGAGITIRAMRAKANKEEVMSFIKETQNFLSQNSPENSPDKYFPADGAPREKAITECRRLQYKEAELFERTKDPRLKKINGELGKWLDSAKDANQRYDRLDGLFREFKDLNLVTQPRVYPAPRITLQVKDLKPSIANTNTANLAPDYVARRKKILRHIDDWQNAIRGLLKRKAEEVTKIIKLGPAKIEPHNYSDQQYKKYDGFKQKLEELKEDQTLKNASGSHYPDDEKIATKRTGELHAALADYNGILKKLEHFKEEAETSFNDANKILNDPNITDGRFENFDRLESAWSHLDNVDSLWPEKPDLEKKKELITKFGNNKITILKRWKDEIEEIDKNAILDDPNSTKMAERLNTDYKTAKLILEETRITNIGDRLPQIKEFDEKLRKASLDLKSKREESKQGK